MVHILPFLAFTLVVTGFIEVPCYGLGKPQQIRIAMRFHERPSVTAVMAGIRLKDFQAGKDADFRGDKFVSCVCDLISHLIILSKIDEKIRAQRRARLKLKRFRRQPIIIFRSACFIFRHKCGFGLKVI
jgi:hypothetical protein